MAPELTSQKQRTVRALELLGQSYLAHEDGDDVRLRELLNQVGAECGVDTYELIRGGMLLGEIPQPGSEGWPGYLAEQQAGLPGDDD